MKRKDYRPDIQRKGYGWSGGEGVRRLQLVPSVEMCGGKLFCSDEARHYVLKLLLENVGADQVVRLGYPNVWREAIASLDVEQAER